MSCKANFPPPWIHPLQRRPHGHPVRALSRVRGRHLGVHPPAGRIRGFHLHIHGRRFRRISAAALPGQHPEFHDPLGERHQFRLQHRGHPERRLPLPQRGPDGLAAHLDRDRRHPARGADRLLPASPVLAGPQGLQTLRGLRASLHRSPAALRAYRAFSERQNRR